MCLFDIIYFIFTLVCPISITLSHKTLLNNNQTLTFTQQSLFSLNLILNNRNLLHLILNLQAKTNFQPRHSHFHKGYYHCWALPTLICNLKDKYTNMFLSKKFVYGFPFNIRETTEQSIIIKKIIDSYNVFKISKEVFYLK